MKCSDIIKILQETAPESCACDWDNPGLLAGRSDKEVKKIYIALDATDEVVDAAIREKADLLLTHHPLIFRPVKKVNDQNFITRRLVRLIQADISLYAMHTNFDAAPEGMAALAAERLDIREIRPLECMGEMKENGTSVPYGIGAVGSLYEPMTVNGLSEKVKKAFDLPFVLVYGPGLMDKEVKRAALCPGSGSSVIEQAVLAGADVLITGDIGHHPGIDAAARGLAVIDGGHYGLEHIFIQHMAEVLREKLKGEAALVLAEPAWPSVLL